MTLRLNIHKECYTTVISAYAPTMTNSEENKDHFYEDLRNVLNKVPPNDKILLLGDFNARVGCNNSDTWQHVVGKHGLGKVNSNGLLLLSLCSEFQLNITNTMFQLPNKYKGTWQHPRSETWLTIDYVITRQEDHADVKLTRAHRGTEVWSDHRLVRSKVKYEIRNSKRRKKNSPPRKVNVALLKDPAKQRELQEALNEKLEHVTIDENIESSWKMLKEALSETSKEVLGFPKRKGEDWFDESNIEALKLIKSLHESHLSLMNDKSSSVKKRAYLQTKAAVQKCLRIMKEAWWSSKAKEIQAAADAHNLKAFYDGLNSIFGPNQIKTSPIESKDGTTTFTDKNDILKRWAEHFKGVLNQPSDVDWSVLHSIEQQAVKCELDQTPALSEVLKAIKKLTINKAPGSDGIPGEIFRHGGINLAKKLTKLIREIWNQECVPQDFKDANICRLFKKGKRSVCDNYRGISLLSIAGKVVARIILDRINSSLLDSICSESQCGFRKGRGTVDMIFSLRQIQEKAREQNKPLYMLFIDLTKAFDTVNRTALWHILKKVGIPEKMRNVIISFHEGMKAQVVIDGVTSDTFDVTNGTKQGCVLAPLLFAIYFAVVLSYAFPDKSYGVPLCYRYSGGFFNNQRFKAKTRTAVTKIFDLLFADDCALVTHSLIEMQEVADTFASACKAFGLTISTKKTELVFQPTPNYDGGTSPQLHIDGTLIKTSESFTYLGSKVTNKALLNDEISTRISRASSRFGRLRKKLWKKHDISLNTKVMVYRAVVIPTLLYGSETWTPYKVLIKKLDAFHLRSLRQICRIKWNDKVPNYVVLTKCNIEGIESFLMKNQLRWVGHTSRMPDDRIPKMLLYGQLNNAPRKVGRPLLRFKDKLKSNLKALEFDLSEWEDLSQQRQEWHHQCHSRVKSFKKRRIEHLKKSRLERKSRSDSTTSNPTSSLTCPDCGKMCRSAAGLGSHRRIHR